MKQFDFSVVRNLRMKRGMAAEELAKRAGLTRVTVANLESGQGNPTIETINALSRVFDLACSELVKMAEIATCQLGETQDFKEAGFEGLQIRFPDSEIFHIKGPKGARKTSDPTRHENTAEICIVLAGRVRASVGGQVHDLGPGQALRFKAMQDHCFDLLEDARFLIIHQKPI